MYLGQIVEIGPAAEIYERSRSIPTRRRCCGRSRSRTRGGSSRATCPAARCPTRRVPPLGCSFHPRCPKAFEVCGWESRDLTDAARGALGAAGRGAVRGGAGALRGSRRARRAGDHGAPSPCAAAATRASVLALLESMRAEDPDEPFWRGVRRLEAAPGRVEIEFHEPRAPRLLPQGEVQVECHLYDPEVAPG